MHHYLCREKYRLELHWDALHYRDEQTVVLEGARFYGPVLKNALRLEAPDFINLDLTPQLLTVFDTYYIARLSWQGVDYSSDGSIALRDVTLVNDHLKTVHKLVDGDFILINTEKHEEEIHPYNLVYESQVVRSDKKPYNYKEE